MFILIKAGVHGLKNQIVHTMKYILVPALLTKSPYTTLFNSFLSVPSLFLSIFLDNRLRMLSVGLFIQSIISYYSTKHLAALYHHHLFLFYPVFERQ